MDGNRNAPDCDVIALLCDNFQARQSCGRRKAQQVAKDNRAETRESIVMDWVRLDPVVQCIVHKTVEQPSFNPITNDNRRERGALGTGRAQDPDPDLSRNDPLPRLHKIQQ